jgi:hypothetical protein
MPPSRFPIPQGTLDMLILQILSLRAAHGYGIAQRLEQISKSVVQVNQARCIRRFIVWSRRVVEGGVEAFGDRARGEVLLADERRAEPARGGAEQLGAAFGRSPIDLR